MAFYLLCVAPELGDVLVVAAADCAALALADAVHYAQLALLVKVEAYYPEEFCLHQAFEGGGRSLVHLLQEVVLEPADLFQ